MVLCGQHRLPENHACTGLRPTPASWQIVKDAKAPDKPIFERSSKVSRWSRARRGRRQSVVYFTKEEKLDLLKSWGILTLAYSFSQYRFIIFMPFYFTYFFLFIYPWVALTAFLTFILHELAHKISAQHYGLEAHYKANIMMLLISLAMSLSGFLFFIGGAVVIEGSYDRKENGIISMAGPLSNIAIATSALLIRFFVSIWWIATFLQSLFLINAWIAVYNLIPAWIFDGRKIFHWSKGVFAGLMSTAIALLVMYYLLFYNRTIFF